MADKDKKEPTITKESADDSVARKEKFVTDMTSLLKSQASVADAKEALRALQYELAAVSQQISDLQYVIAKIGQDLLAQLESK